MLKPIEILQEMQADLHLNEGDIELQKTKLIEALSVSAQDPEVEAIYAHGAEALRVVKIVNKARGLIYWGVQTWSIYLHEWITQNLFQLTDREKAVAMARDWYDPMSEAAAVTKWNAAGDLAHIEETFDTHDKLVEFFYDTKAVRWQSGNPWPVASLIAETVVDFKGIFKPGFHFQDVINDPNITLQAFHQMIKSIIDRLEHKWHEHYMTISG